MCGGVITDWTIMLTPQAEQETHVAAVGSAFRRLGSIDPPHLVQVPYVPSAIRFRAPRGPVVLTFNGGAPWRAWFSADALPSPPSVSRVARSKTPSIK